MKLSNINIQIKFQLKLKSTISEIQVGPAVSLTMEFDCAYLLYPERGFYRIISCNYLLYPDSLCKFLEFPTQTLVSIHVRPIHIPAAPPGFRFGGGNMLGGRPGRGSGGGRSPPDAGKFSKNFLKKITINAQF